MVSTEEQEVSKETVVWPYCNDKVHLALYVDGTKSPLFSNEFLFFLYSQCKRDKILNILFPGKPDITPAWFVSYLKDRTVLVGITKPTFEIAGFAFLYEVEGSGEALKATVGFAFFKKWWGSSEIKDISRFALSWWFNEAKLKIIFGTTLWRNRLAWKFAREMGFSSLGKIPMFFCRNGSFEDAHLVYLKEEDFKDTDGRTKRLNN